MAILDALLGFVVNHPDRRDELKEVLQQLKESAEQGDPLAQFDLGNFYATGEHVGQDFEQAVPWWERAAQSGVHQAQYNLGISYIKDEDIEVNLVEGYSWLLLAEVLGSEHAKEVRENLVEVMSSDDLAEAEALSMRRLEAIHRRLDENGLLDDDSLSE